MTIYRIGNTCNVFLPISISLQPCGLHPGLTRLVGGQQSKEVEAEVKVIKVKVNVINLYGLSSGVRVNL